MQVLMHPSRWLHTGRVNVASSKEALKMHWSHSYKHICSLSECSVMFAQPQVLQTLEGLWGSCDSMELLCFIPAPDPVQCCVTQAPEPVLPVWAAVAPAEPPGCWGGTQEGPCHLSSSTWGVENIYQSHNWWGEGISAASKGVVHLPPLAMSWE